MRYLTSLFEAYPPLLGRAVGEASRLALGMRAEALARQGVVPMLEPVHDRGNPMLEMVLAQEESLREVAVMYNSWPSTEPEDTNDDLWQMHQVREVDEGGGAWTGMTVQEHYNWAINELRHDGAKAWGLELHPLLDSNINQVAQSERDCILAKRVKFLEVLRVWKEETLPIARAWAEEVPADCRKLYESLNIPLFSRLLKVVEHDDPALVHDLMYGFPVAGKMPTAGPGTRPGAWGMELSEGEVDKCDVARQVFGRLREYEYSHDVHLESCKDAMDGYMTVPVPVETITVQDKLWTRRLPVREVRMQEQGEVERTRIVDHASESFLNSMCHGTSRCVTETVDWLAALLLKTMLLGITCCMFKRDVSKAFRRCPNKWGPPGEGQQHLTWCTYMYESTQWATRHVGSCFGSVASVWNFHRVAEGLLHIGRAMAGLLLCRYVDDFFGVDLMDIPEPLRAGQVFDELLRSVGFPDDPKKSADQRLEMTVLGVKVCVDHRKEEVTFQIEQQKAQRWLKDCETILQSGSCSAGLASKMAGRLSSVVTNAMNQCGRAYVRAFYAQQAAPVYPASPWLMMSVCFWVRYLQMQPVSSVCTQWFRRPRLVAWTDAAGHGGVAAVVWTQRTGLRFTRDVLPDHIRQQLLERGDNQIGVMETITVLLLLQTYGELIQDSLMHCFIDNNGSMYAWIRGGSKCPEQNIFVGEGWLMLAGLNTNCIFHRVTSESNLADGPSRGDVELLRLLGAQEDPPVWPQWLHDFWTAPGANL